MAFSAIGLDTSPNLVQECLPMKTATIQDLRNAFPRVVRWIEEGECVDITRSGKPFEVAVGDMNLTLTPRLCN